MLFAVFENDNIIHVNNKVDPADDIDVINTELALSDLDTCERALHRVQKKAKGGDKDAKAEQAALEKCLPQLENAGMLRALKNLTEEDKAAIKYLSFPDAQANDPLSLILQKLDDADREEFMAELGLEEPGLNRVIRAGYELLNLQTYFTAGVKEVRAWTIPVGATAPQAAGKIHTDFEKGFIRAQTIAYEDYITYKEH
ncbi:unnamed protein product [Ranitomeya imitator]|uniref:TGS domain-containing protein n=1 Tax=Ranitomeya imitator TaxID=111125 RepID=A0ABN9LRF9_9NEOB|nr:unnamed protein product [Ranitomeya imitator]